MKKILILLALIFSIASAGFADHGNGLALGILWAGHGWGHGIGLSLVVPNLPIFWGIHLGLGGGLSLSVTGDKYLFDANLVPISGDMKLDWYLGVGLYGDLAIWNNYLGLAAGLRVPIGLSFHVIKQLEIFSEIAPYIGLRILPPINLDWGWLNYSSGIRWWF